MKLDVDVLPREVGQLDALTKLYLDGCPMEKLPPEVAQLLNLNDLHINGCPKLGAATMELPEGVTDPLSVPAQDVIACYAPLLIVEPRKKTPGQLHTFLLDNPLAVPPFFKSILTNAAHADWLGEAVKATPELTELTDASGRHAIGVAHETCRQRMQETSWLCKRYELQAGPPEHQSATSVVIRAEDHADKPDYAQNFDDAVTNKSGTLEGKELDMVAKELTLEGKELDMVAKELGLSKDLILSVAMNKHGSWKA